MITEVTSQRVAGAPSGSLDNVVLTFPGAPTPGNLLVAAISFAPTTFVDIVPDDWTMAGEITTERYTAQIYYKVAGGSEPGAYTWTFASPANKRFRGGTEFTGFTSVLLDKFAADFDEFASVPDAPKCSPTGVLSTSDQAIFAAYFTPDSRYFIAHDNGQTEIGSGAGSIRGSLTTKIVSSNADTNYGATMSGIAAWGAMVATFMDDGPVTFTLPAAGGTLALNGQAASLSLVHRLEAGARAFTITGSDAILFKRRIVSGLAGALTITGSSATLLRNRKLTGGSRAYTINGSSVSFQLWPAAPDPEWNTLVPPETSPRRVTPRIKPYF